jgi:hypothetical protein
MEFQARRLFSGLFWVNDIYMNAILLRIDDALVNLVLTNLPITGGIVILLCVTWLIR